MGGTGVESQLEIEKENISIGREMKESAVQKESIIHKQGEQSSIMTFPEMDIEDKVKKTTKGRYF